jgi:signal transduction histidine kinase
MGTLPQPLQILIVETASCEAHYLSSELCKGGYDVSHRQVATAESMQDALCTQSWDIVLSSHTLPHFSAMEALSLIQNIGLDLPFIVLFDRFEEAAAIEVMKAGANDCLLKGYLKRLVPTVTRELRAAEIRQRKRQTEAALLELTIEELTEHRLAETLAYEFISVLNHEFRTPLTSIQASIELLQTGRLGTLSERGQHLLEIAARNTDRLVQLTNRMLDPGSFKLGLFDPGLLNSDSLNSGSLGSGSPDSDLLDSGSLASTPTRLDAVEFNAVETIRDR